MCKLSNRRATRELLLRSKYYHHWSRQCVRMCVHMRSVCRHDDAVIIIAHSEEDDLFRVFGADEDDIGTWTTTKSPTTTNRWYIAAAAAASAAVPSAILPSCGVYNKRGMRMSDVCACALCMRMSRSGILCICCGLNARWPVSRRTVFLKGARVGRGMGGYVVRSSTRACMASKQMNYACER